MTLILRRSGRQIKPEGPGTRDMPLDQLPPHDCPRRWHKPPRVSGPNYPFRLRLWRWIIRRTPFLDQLYRGELIMRDMPSDPPGLDDAFKATLIAAFCDKETRAAVQLLLLGAIEESEGPHGR